MRCNHRRVALGNAVPISQLTSSIDTLIVAGGPGAESGQFARSFIAGIAAAAARSRRVASICT
ncbi:MAG TPA: hypothetical protein VHN81_12305 [Edaphobacter sp.]|nr:hypothetical protein [Edaphobacter sp.]